MLFSIKHGLQDPKSLVRNAPLYSSEINDWTFGRYLVLKLCQNVLWVTTADSKKLVEESFIDNNFPADKANFKAFGAFAATVHSATKTLVEYMLLNVYCDSVR